MKRFSLIGILALILLFTGCKMEMPNISNWEKVNYSDSENEAVLKTTNSEYATNFEIDGNILKIYGKTDNDKHNYLIVYLDKGDEPETKIPVINGDFSGEISLDGRNNTLVEIYGGEEEYGTFESIILDFVNVEKNGNGWRFVKSPVYEQNKAIFNREKADDLNTAEDAEITKLSNEIVMGLTDDYEKVKAIHHWVAENIYYDFDALSSGNYENMDAKGVFMTKRGVCEGYANLFSALVQCQNIPCRIQSGYALGIDTNQEWNTSNVNTAESNHAWNEVYVDNRWIIVDATWDSQNKYINGEYIKGNAITQIYFDSTLEFFSLSHKLIDGE